jgi:hypothetical protein
LISSRLSGYGIHCDIVNPKLLELQAAKETLADLYDIQISQVDDLIMQHIVDFRLTAMEFQLYISARRPCLS